MVVVISGDKKDTKETKEFTLDDICGLYSAYICGSYPAAICKDDPDLRLANKNSFLKLIGRQDTKVEMLNDMLEHFLLEFLSKVNACRPDRLDLPLLSYSEEISKIVSVLLEHGADIHKKCSHIEFYNKTLADALIEEFPKEYFLPVYCADLLNVALPYLIKLHPEPERLNKQLTDILIGIARADLLFYQYKSQSNRDCQKKVEALVDALLNHDVDVATKFSSGEKSIVFLLDLLRPTALSAKGIISGGKDGLARVFSHHIYLQEQRAKLLHEYCPLVPNVRGLVVQYLKSEYYPVQSAPTEFPVFFPEIYAQILYMGAEAEKRKQQKTQYRNFENRSRLLESAPEKTCMPQGSETKLEFKVKAEGEKEETQKGCSFSKLPQDLYQLSQHFLEKIAKFDADKIRSLDDCDINTPINNEGTTIVNLFEQSGCFLSFSRVLSCARKPKLLQRERFSIMVGDVKPDFISESSLLVRLIKSRNVDALRKLLESNLNLNINEPTFLPSAPDIWFRKMPALLWCFEKGSELIGKFPNDRITYQMIELLLQHGADLTKTSQARETIGRNEIEVVQNSHWPNIIFTPEDKKSALDEFFSNNLQPYKVTALDLFISKNNNGYSAENKLFKLFARYIYADLKHKNPNKELTPSDFKPYSAQRRSDHLWKLLEKVGREEYEKFEQYQNWLKRQKPGF